MDGEKIKSGKVDEVSPYELIPEKCSSVHEPVQTTPAWPGVHADAREVALHRWAGGSGRPGRPPARRMAGQFSAPWVPCGSSLATLLVPSFSFSARRYVYALSTLKLIGMKKMSAQPSRTFWHDCFGKRLHLRGKSKCDCEGASTERK